MVWWLMAWLALGLGAALLFGEVSSRMRLEFDRGAAEDEQNEERPQASETLLA